MTRSSKSPRSSHLTLATGWGECCDIDLDEMSYLLSHLSLSLSLLRSFLFYQTKVPKHKHYTKNGHHQGFRSSGRSISSTTEHSAPPKTNVDSCPVSNADHLSDELVILATRLFFRATQIFDSRGNPTVEVDLHTEKGECETQRGPGLHAGLAVESKLIPRIVSSCVVAFVAHHRSFPK